MMPTSPRSPLSFRTPGFPLYGWKDGVSDGAFPTRRSVQACSRHTLTTYWHRRVTDPTLSGTFVDTTGCTKDGRSHGHEKSDSAIVATKPPNKAGRPAAEAGERRAGAKENANRCGTCRTQGRESGSQ